MFEFRLRRYKKISYVETTKKKYFVFYQKILLGGYYRAIGLSESMNMFVRKKFLNLFFAYNPLYGLAPRFCGIHSKKARHCMFVFRYSVGESPVLALK